MPELPDISVYVDALTARLVGQALRSIRFISPFLLRSVDPPIESAFDRPFTRVHRLGKQIIFDLDGELHLVLHLMIAGRLQWAPPGAKPRGKIGLATFDVDTGSLLLTEASGQKRASLHLVRGMDALRAFDRGGLELDRATFEQFLERLQSEQHTLKRSLTDPRLFSGIGNAYSGEILHRARLSPMDRSQNLDETEARRLFNACRTVLREWTERLREETGDGFPAKVTAFRPDMAVHGKFGKPCPSCGTTVQRIVYAANECNYCPRCQTKGRILADRSLSRLLKEDWPRTVEDL
ncbi:MAG: formamidopyrimidine-DNA glycosylase [Bacteroidetes bacterium]|jgi:formamidopyrimidine-DNA glycosylase|nr:formamidopyrimidine-DNA glycosylase [Bacteroidota bacterium]